MWLTLSHLLGQYFVTRIFSDRRVALAATVNLAAVEHLRFVICITLGLLQLGVLYYLVLAAVV